MATLGTFNKVILSGAFAGGETWSTGLCLADFTSTTSDAVDSFTELEAAAANILAYVDTNAGSLPFSGLSSAGSVEQVRVECRDASNTLIQAAEAVTSDSIVGSPAPVQASQTALVASLMTGQPGRRYRGRMYWPLCTSAPTTSWRVATAVRDAVANGTVDYVNACGVALSAGALVSQAAVVSLTGQVCTVVQSVRVGDVFDTQRRRRDAFVESEITLELTP